MIFTPNKTKFQGKVSPVKLEAIGPAEKKRESKVLESFQDLNLYSC